MSVRERLDTLSRGELTGLVVVVVLALAGAGLWYARALPRPIQVAEGPSAAAPSVAGSLVSVAPSPGPSQAPLIVDVAGWVRHPGVYEFPPGARVIDAVERAGGARAGADLTLLNLAAPLADGQQILVLTVGSASGAAGGGVIGAGGTPLVNLNTADAAALETLNGIGESLAAAIVQYRTEHGPFTSVDQLDQVSGIGPATLEKLRPYVTV